MLFNSVGECIDEIEFEDLKKEQEILAEQEKQAMMKVLRD